MLTSRNTLAAAALAAAAFAGAPRVAMAQTLVHTIPHSDSTIPRSPFDMGRPDMEAAGRIAGCYTLSLGAFTPAQAPGDTLAIPPSIELSTEPHTRIYVGFRLVARTPGSSPQTDRYPAAWSTIGGDSLQLRLWANGRSSLMLFLRLTPDRELRGIARHFTGAELVDDDTGRWLWERYPAAPATLRPTSCEGRER